MVKKVVGRPASIYVVFAVFYIFYASRIFSAIVVPNLSLSWDPSPDPSVKGYRLHSGTTSGHYTEHIDVGTRTHSSVAGLKKGATYYFAVTAYNSDGIESDPSNEIIFVVPGAIRLSPGRSPGYRMRVEFVVQDGRRYILQASEDLQTWVDLYETKGSANSWVGYLDTRSSDAAQRFYRLKLK